MSENDRELEDLAQELARFGSMSAPAALRSRVRAEIMAAPVAPLAPRGARWLGALRPLLAAVLVVAVLAAAGGSAAAGSLPGDAAFPIKRAVENVQVALAADDIARLDLLTQQLDRRLADLETVAAGRPGSVGIALSEYAAALARVETQLSVVAREAPTAARDAAVARATAAAADHVARLRALEATLPAAAQPGIQRAIDAQQRIEDRGAGGPQQPGSPNESANPSRPGSVPGSQPGSAPGGAPSALPGGAPSSNPGAAPSARPSVVPSRTDHGASPPHK